MTKIFTTRQLTGQCDSHLQRLPDGHQLHPGVATAFAALQREAEQAGFKLAIASGYRSFERQCAIWNAKAGGGRPVHDDSGQVLDLTSLTASGQLRAILRYSAMPGTSRHHWGTDLDVYDAAAVATDYQVQLTPQEVAPGGPFDPLHRWLDQRMAADQTHGFFRPYGLDAGGVAPERWHLSYAPLALACEGRVTGDVLLACWDAPAAPPLALRQDIEQDLENLLRCFARVPAQWCPYA